MEPTGKKLTFDEMPGLLVVIMERFDTLNALLKEVLTGHYYSDWMDIDELREYLPGHQARTTIYEWIRCCDFPHYKRGKSYYFLKSEVDKWLMNG